MTTESTNTAIATEVVYGKIMEMYAQHEKKADRFMAYLEKDFIEAYASYSQELYEHKFMMKLIKRLVSEINDVTDADDYNGEYHFEQVFTRITNALTSFVSDTQNIRSQSSNPLYNECSTIEYKCKVRMLQLIKAWQTLLKSECDENALNVYFFNTLH